MNTTDVYTWLIRVMQYTNVTWCSIEKKRNVREKNRRKIR